MEGTETKVEDAFTRYLKSPDFRCISIKNGNSIQ